jgi:hypothetical protein
MQYRFSFMVGMVVLLSLAPVRSDAQTASKCARSFCGCSTPVDRALAVFVNGQVGGKPVSGIELRCEEPSPVLATTDAAGRISTTVRVYTTPGCGLVRCRELLFIDPSGRYATSKIRFPESETTLLLERVDAKVATATEQPDPGPCAANEGAGPTTSMLRACAEQKLAAAEASLDS